MRAGSPAWQSLVQYQAGGLKKINELQTLYLNNDRNTFSLLYTDVWRVASRQLQLAKGIAAKRGRDKDGQRMKSWWRSLPGVSTMGPPSKETCPVKIQCWTSSSPYKVFSVYETTARNVCVEPGWKQLLVWQVTPFSLSVPMALTGKDKWTCGNNSTNYRAGHCSFLT